MSLVLLSLLSAPTRAAAVDERRELSPGAEVAIETICGALSVTGVDRSEVLVRGEVEGDGELVISGGGGSLRMAIKPKQPDGRNRDVCATLQVELPRGVRLDVDGVSSSVAISGLRSRISVETVSGKVQVGAGAELIAISSVSGDLEVGGSSGELEVETVSGRVAVQGVKGRLSAASVSGDLDVSGGPYSRAELSTVSGDIELKGALDAEARVTISSHSGDVALRVPDDTPGRYVLESFSGDLEAAGQPSAEGMVDRRLDFTRGDGGADVSIGTFSGDVCVCSL